MILKDEELRFNMPIRKPVISSRLPKAFSQPKHLTNKKFEDLTSINEFKNVKKLLSPLKQLSPENSALRQIINKLAHFPKFSNPAQTLTVEMLHESKLKIEDLVTLSIIKSSSNKSGIVKKSFHTPTHKIYASKEFPLETVVMRQKLVELLKTWQNLQKGSRYLVQVHATYWNTPEGFLTIIMDHMPHDSLLTLCETIGAIPERVLKSIAKRILAALSHIHKKSGPYGGIDLSHILFGSEGKVKLGLGLGSRVQTREESSKRAINAEEDVFDFGATLLSAGVGGPEWAEECWLLKGECCLFHTAIISSEIPYLNRFSKDFSAFLCLATRYNRDDRGKLTELSAHEWLKSNESVGADVTTKELLDMAGGNFKEGDVERHLNFW